MPTCRCCNSNPPSTRGATVCHNEISPTVEAAVGTRWLLGAYMSRSIRGAQAALGCAVSLLVAGCGGSPGSTSFIVGGSLSGLAAGGKVVLQNIGGSAMTVSSNGSFGFTLRVATGSKYIVTVLSQPAGQNCTILDGSGTVIRGNVTNIVVVCASEWTWIAGLSSNSASGSYGAQGEPYPGFMSGARSGARSWCDAAGNFWLFGGYGNDAEGHYGYLNDLWKYDPRDNSGTWVSGSKTTDASGVYGIQGTATPDNVPGARENASSWFDASGNFWLFGGYGVDSTGAGGYLSDLWKFNPRSGLWTWISGSNGSNTRGIYGTRGVPSASNVPGSRAGAISWIDSSGRLWLFGGFGDDLTGTLNDLNDLWKFEPSTSTWTWISGSNTADAGGAYGTQGAAAAANVPGAREYASSWADGSGNFWLFGGSGYDSNDGGGLLNDLWKFEPGVGTWTWIGGSNTTDSAGIYGTQGITAPENLPGARSYATSWTDSAGNLWLFSGEGHDDVGVNGYLNDLWRFDVSAGTWTWVGGLSTAGASGAYGSEGIAAPSNVPGSRKWASGCAQASGDFWLFGGEGVDSTGNTGLLNDLWTYSL